VFTRIQWRIAASYIGLIALALLALGVYLVGFLQRQQLNTLEAQLKRQALLVADNALYRLAAGGTDSLDRLAKQLGQDIGARITIIASDGTVLADSDHDPATMDNHITRPEVLQALQTGAGQSVRHSTTLERDLLYVAVPMEQGGRSVGVARVAMPVREIQESSNQVVAAVGGALAVAALLAIVLAIVLARITAGPVRALTHAARRVAAGDLDQVIAIRGQDEVSLLARAFNDMAASLRTHIRAVERERARLSAVLSHMGDGLIIADRDGLVRLVNPAAAQLLQIKPEGAEGRSLMAVLRDHELAALVSATLAGDLAAGGPQLVELGRHGQRRPVQAMASRIPSGEGEGEQVLLILHDVTQLRQAERVRREFVANVSHELRTPLAAMKALAETLEDGALSDPPAARTFLRRLHNEVDELSELLQELLELSRIESGQAEMWPQPIALEPLLRSSVDRLAPLAERAGLQLRLAIPSDLPPVAADSERVRQVLANLLHNAIKFTPTGGWVELRAGVRSQQSGAGQGKTDSRKREEIVVSVADSGVGIPSQDLDRVFERFYKTDPSRSGGGTGLGLAIAKHIVQAHGGRIWAESRGSHGTTFSFTLPLASNESNVREPETSPVGRGTSTGGSDR
jgi:two-component system phosphate regulon sensor histidine kinase PhoR